MNNFKSDYAALAAADRRAAANSSLENVRRKFLRSADHWDLLAAAEIKFDDATPLGQGKASLRILKRDRLFESMRRVSKPT